MHNIANLPQEEKDKINADLAASGIAYKERLGLPYDLYETESQQPEHLRAYFRERLEHCTEVSAELPESGKQWLRDRVRETKARLMPKHVATIVPFADSNENRWLFPDGSIEYTRSTAEKKAGLLGMVLQEIERYRFNN